MTPKSVTDSGDTLFSLVTPLLIAGFLFIIFEIVFLFFFFFCLYRTFCTLLNVYFVPDEGKGLCASVNFTDVLAGL
jgi:hypothetical protein